MVWYAAEGPVSTDWRRGLKLMNRSKIPKVRELIARRIASLMKGDNN